MHASYGRGKLCRMAKKRKPVLEDLATALTNLFLPVPYRIGVAFEETLRCGRLHRKQVAILLLMQAAGGAACSMRRKDIERLLAAWFETSSSTITPALGTLAQSPLQFVRIGEDPDLGCEKRVTLTTKGKKFLLTMDAASRTFAQRVLERMPKAEIRAMVRLMNRSIEALEQG